MHSVTQRRSHWCGRVFLSVLILGSACSRPDHDETTATSEPRDITQLVTALAQQPQDSQALVAIFKQVLAVSRKGTSQSNFCKLASLLDRIMTLAQGIAKTRHSVIAEDIFNQASTLRASLLGRPGTSCPTAMDFNQPPKVAIVASDNHQLNATIHLGEPLFTTRTGNGETFTDVHLPGVYGFGDAAGLPAVPVLHRLIGVPLGATARIVSASRKIRSRLKVHVYPVQNQALDQVRPISQPDPRIFATPPFSKNQAAYTSAAAFPSELCEIKPAGFSRDLQLAEISCALGQYVPAKDTLDVFSDIAVSVAFESGSGAFLPARALSPFENTSVHTKSLLNAQAVISHVSKGDNQVLACAGEELLILTPAVFKPAADTLAAWKASKGIMTRVRLVDNDSGGYLSNTAIRSLIASDYNRCVVRPSYVLLLGDAGFIAPFYPSVGTGSGIASDYPYAVRSRVGGTLAALPDFAVGRIPVTSLEQANVVVNKVISYEETPPSGFPFYENAAIAAFFQPSSAPNSEREERTFIQVSEQMRDGMSALGYTVQRIYNRTMGPGIETPSQFNDGTALPTDLGPSSGFSWNGSTADISAAINAGRFLVFHRDHGWADGWGDPHFDTTNAGALTNGELLPVVFSVNCASGYFDDETDPSGTGTDGARFVETLLRNASGGAVGVIGDTRNSPSWENSVLSRGFFDAVWPAILPAFGDSTSSRRLGDILNHGKAYLVDQEGLSNEAVQSELLLYHVFGDPTMEMWTAHPGIKILPIEYVLLEEIPRFPIPEPDPTPYFGIGYPVENAVLTAYQLTPNNEPIAIARGVVHGGKAQMIGVSTFNPQLPLKISASLDGAISKPLVENN